VIASLLTKEKGRLWKNYILLLKNVILVEFNLGDELLVAAEEMIRKSAT
jgi:hypothetical protein